MGLIKSYLNNQGKKKTQEGIHIGFNNLPLPIVQFLENGWSSRGALPHVYHVTQLTRCILKSYIYLVSDQKTPDKKGLLSIFRGRLFDNAFSPLFKRNQRNFIVSREGISVTGTFDFVWDGYVYDLKIPGSTFFHKNKGAGLCYRRQVQSYLGLAHENGELLDISRGRVLMIAEDVVVTDVEEDPDIIEWLFSRARSLDTALASKDLSLLAGPLEPEWECKVCSANNMFRSLFCKKIYVRRKKYGGTF